MLVSFDCPSFCFFRSLKLFPASSFYNESQHFHWSISLNDFINLTNLIRIRQKSQEIDQNGSSDRSGINSTPRVRFPPRPACLHSRFWPLVPVLATPRMVLSRQCSFCSSNCWIYWVLPPYSFRRSLEHNTLLGLWYFPKLWRIWQTTIKF